MLTIRRFVASYSLILAGCAMALSVASCKTKPPTGAVPPTPPDFGQALQYANRAALAYEENTVIQSRSAPGMRISISPPLALGVKAYVEVDDAARVQWIAVRGTSNLINLQTDVDYNKVVESRLQVPLHKGFADSALEIYRFAKPLLRQDYETRITGHSLGGAAAVIVLMLLKEDGFKLGPAMTFGQPKVTNRDGARKYGALPLVRFVTEKDPIPLLPPFEVFAVLDEGPYRHFGPEVVLQEGANYLFFPAHEAGRLSVLSFWNNLKNLSIQDVPEHYMSRYLTLIQQKVPAPPRQ